MGQVLDLRVMADQQQTARRMVGRRAEIEHLPLGPCEAALRQSLAHHTSGQAVGLGGGALEDDDSQGRLVGDVRGGRDELNVHAISQPKQS